MTDSQQITVLAPEKGNPQEVYFFSSRGTMVAHPEVLLIVRNINYAEGILYENMENLRKDIEENNPQVNLPQPVATL